MNNENMPRTPSSTPDLMLYFCLLLFCFFNQRKIKNTLIKIRKRTKIRNQAPHLIQDTNGKVTTSQLDITNESQEASPFPAGDIKSLINRSTRKHNKKDRININDPQKKHRLETVSKNILLEGLNRFHSPL